MFSSGFLYNYCLSIQDLGVAERSEQRDTPLLIPLVNPHCTSNKKTYLKLVYKIKKKYILRHYMMLFLVFLFQLIFGTNSRTLHYCSINCIFPFFCLSTVYLYAHYSKIHISLLIGRIPYVLVGEGPGSASRDAYGASCGGRVRSLAHSFSS